jgi:hypothetical protein
MIFGGASGCCWFGVMNDIWVLSNANGLGTPAWTQLTATSAPPVRMSGEAAYDPRSNRLALYGGGNTGSTFYDVWVLSNANGMEKSPSQWSQLTVAGTAPNAAWSSAAAFDSAHNRMMLFGGGGPNNLVANGYWVLDGAVGAAPAPVANAGASQKLACTGSNGATVTLDGSASTGNDLSYLWTDENGAVVGTQAQVSVFVPLGAHTFTLTVTDAMGATSTARVSVEVGDSMPPSLSLALSPNVLWPPNGSFVRITASLQASDACDPNPSVSLVSIVSNQDITGDVQGATFGSDDRTFMVRARRDLGHTRVYAVTYRATAASGRTSETKAYVVVPDHQMP